MLRLVTFQRLAKGVREPSSEGIVLNPSKY